MARAKRGFKARRRRNKVLKQAKGYTAGRGTLFRSAIETVRRAGQYAYRDRRVKKRDFRSLWIVRISAAVKALDLSYSKFVHGLKSLGVELNRKWLSELAIQSPKAFEELVKQVKSRLAA